MQRLHLAWGSLASRHRKKINYLFVGGLLFMIDLVVTLTAFYILHINPGFASAIGFSSSFVAGFALNRNVVFKHTNTSRFSMHTQLTLYLLLSTVNLFITSYSVNLLVNQGLRIELVKPLVVIVAACWNYFILGHYIFSHNRSEEVN